MLEIRENTRYGLFKVNTSHGEAELDINISGFGEIFKLKINDNEYNIDSIDDEESYYETDKYIELYCGYPCYLGDVKIYKPFVECIKNHE